jgi:hypothetical protein
MGKKTDDISNFAPGMMPVLTYQALLGCALFLVTLFDFYLVGVRIMDLMALLLVGVALLFSHRAKIKFLTHIEYVRKLLVLILLVIIYVAIGMAADIDNAKACLGFMFGIAIFCFYYIVPLSKRKLYQYLAIGLFIHTTFMLIQFFYFYTVGSVLNFHMIVGIEPRLLSSIFRPAGLFQEPAIYCLNTFMLLTLRQRLRPNVMTKSDWYAALTLPLTFSFWGLGAVGVYMTIARPKIILALIPVLVIACVYVFIAFDIGDNPFYEMAKTRTTNLEADGSAQDRYGGIYKLFQSPSGNAELWFGRGVNTDFDELGGNGFSFMFNVFGIIGALLFILIYLTLLQKAYLAQTLFFFLFTLTAAPIWTGLAYWLWLCFMAKSFGRDSNSTQHVSVELPIETFKKAVA